MALVSRSTIFNEIIIPKNDNHGSDWNPMTGTDVNNENIVHNPEFLYCILNISAHII